MYVALPDNEAPLSFRITKLPIFDGQTKKDYGLEQLFALF